MAVEALTVRVNVDEVVVWFGLKTPSVPLGKPLMPRVTGELNPFVLFTVTV